MIERLLRKALNRLGHPAKGNDDDREQIEGANNSFIAVASVFRSKHAVLCENHSLGLYYFANSIWPTTLHGSRTIRAKVKKHSNKIGHIDDSIAVGVASV